MRSSLLIVDFLRAERFELAISFGLLGDQQIFIVEDEEDGTQSKSSDNHWLAMLIMQHTVSQRKPRRFATATCLGLGLQSSSDDLLPGTRFATCWAWVCSPHLLRGISFHLN